MKSAQVQVAACLHHIQRTAWAHISQNVFLGQHLGEYLSSSTFHTINEVGDLYLCRATTKEEYAEELEPKALLIDSMLPISAEIDHQNVYKPKQATQGSAADFTKQTGGKRIGRAKNISQEGQSCRRVGEVFEEEEDNLVKELRRVQDERINGLARERRAKEEEDRVREQKSRNRSQKDERLVYDYSGGLVRMSNGGNPKSSLVEKVVNGAINSKTDLVKQAQGDLNPSNVEGTPSKQLKKNALKKILDIVEFSGLASLIEGMQVKSGIKYKHNEAVLQAPNQELLPSQLKKIMSTRKLSKSEYSKIEKIVTNSPFPLEPVQQQSKPVFTQKGSLEQAIKRSQSDAQLRTSVRRDTIRVSNPDLCGELFEATDYNPESTFSGRYGTLDSGRNSERGSLKPTVIRRYALKLPTIATKPVAVSVGPPKKKGTNSMGSLAGK